MLLFTPYISGGGGSPPTVLVIEETTKGSHSGSNTTTHIINVPTTSNSGDILLCFFSCDGVPTLNSASPGWVPLGSATRSSNITGAVYFASSPVGATPLTIFTSSGEASSHIVYRISGSDTGTTPEVNFSSTFGNPNPPLLTPSGGAQEYLWIATGYYDRQNSSTNPPTDYTFRDNLNHPNSYGASISVADRLFNASSQDPDNWGVSDNVVASTLAVYPL